MEDLWSALCLVAVFEGLLLFAMPNAWRRAAEQLHAMPNAWRRAAEQLHAMPNRWLRAVGGLVVAAGLAALALVRHAL